MNVLITGGAGFLGRRLAHALLQRGALRGSDGRLQPVDRITLADVAALPPAGDRRIACRTGDLADGSFLAALVGEGADSIFHLAAIVSGMAEADFDLGMRVNVDASRALLDACRRTGGSPRVVFASSVAVYGGELPAVVQDATAVLPQSSYGMEKAIVELLINEYSRRGFIDGRVLRLPTISVRPGRPNAAASSFASGIIREPLNGEPAVCPVDPSTTLWLASPAAAIDGFIALHDVPASRLGQSRIVNGPGLSVSVAEMISALERVAGPEYAARIAVARDPRIERIVATWPGAWDDSRARGLGLPADDSFDTIIRRYMEDAALKISGFND